jgi:hypothetical protein
MNITFEPGAVFISMKKGDEPAFRQERKAVIAYRNGLSTGLAYLLHADEEGKISYSVTHIASGVDVCPQWFAETEEEAQKWIKALLTLADWTGEVPRATAPVLKLLRYAVVGLCYELAEKPGEDS